MLVKVAISAFVVAFLGLLFAAACFSGGSKDTVPEASALLCQELKADDIDFTILNDIYEQMQHSSVFRERAEDPDALLRGGIAAVFQQLGIPQDSIPQWVWEEIDGQVKTGKVDFGVYQTIFERLRDDPAYQNDPAYQDFRNPGLAREFFRTAIDGVIRKGLRDPFAHYIDAEALRMGQSDLSGTYQGVGMRHDLQGGRFVVAEVFPGGPAEKAGMQTDDDIIAVDSKSLQGCSSYAFTQSVRGKADTTVTLTVKRGDETLDIVITRDVIQQQSVHSCPGYPLSDGRGMSNRLLPQCPLRDAQNQVVGDILYIKFEEFNEQAAKDLGSILRQASLAEFRGIVFDLRANPGGRVDILMRTLDYFFKDQVPFKYTDFSRREFAGGFGVVAVQETQEGFWRAMYAYDRFDYATEIPMMVLVGRDPHEQSRKGADNNSFSASEGFSGAAQDYGRAILIGEGRTGGKGTTNLEFKLRGGDAGAINLAIGLWRTPNGNTPQGEDTDGDGFEDSGGLTPDIIVRWTDEDFTKANSNSLWDPVLYRAMHELSER